MTKVLITGANGFLASNTIRELLERGIEVRGMLRPKANEKSLEGLYFERYYGSITNPLDVLHAANGCDYIIHTAADTSQHYSNSQPLNAVNVLGTQNVIEATIANNVKRLIYVSTVNTIGLESGKTASNEILSSLYRHSGYAKSKYLAEQCIREQVKNKLLDAIIVQPSFMIGAFDAKPSSGRIILHYLKSKIALYPSGGKNFVDVTCVAKAICNAMELGRNGNTYVLAGENLTYKEFSTIVYKLEPRKNLKIQIPSLILIAVGVLGSILRTMGIKSELNYYNSRILTQCENLSGRQAEIELNMPISSIQSAAGVAIRWFKLNGYFS